MSSQKENASLKLDRKPLYAKKNDSAISNLQEFFIFLRFFYLFLGTVILITYFSP